MNRHYRFWLLPFGIALVLILCFVVRISANQQDRLVDLLFTKRSLPAPVVIVDVDDASIRELGQWPWPRARFAQLINRLQQAGAIALDIDFKEPSHFGTTDDNQLAQALAQSQPPVILSSEIINQRPSLPLEDFQRYSSYGYTNMLASSDGVVRRFQPQMNEDGSFAFLTSHLYQQYVFKNSELDAPHQPTRIFYFGPDHTFTHIAVKDVIEGTISPDVFVHQIVLVGVTAHDLQDYHQTPLGLMSGVEVQANTIATILSHHYLVDDRRSTILAIILLAFVTALAIRFLSGFGRIVVALALIFTSYNIIAFLSFDHLRILDLLYPNLAIIFTTIATMIFQYITAHHDKHFIQESFGHYLSRHVINELIKDPGKLSLGGKRETLTIMFSDIRSFTTISETMDPETLAHFLNQYLGVMSDIILEHDGVIDKYIGDAIVAFWGAPLPNNKHALHGILSACAMIDALRIFNERNAQRYPPIAIGIGINSGDVTVGNMGSERRFDYTVIGDNVNLASRLEGLTKYYGVGIIISAATAQAISDEERQRHQIILRELDRIRVKGKTQAVTIFEAIPRSHQAALVDVMSDFDKARQAYYDGNFASALESFENILQRLPNDGPSKLLLERSRQFAANHPTDWSGVFDIKEK